MDIIRIHQCRECGDYSHLTAERGLCESCQAKSRKETGYYELKKEIEKLNEKICQIQKSIEKISDRSHCSID